MAQQVPFFSNFCNFETMYPTYFRSEMKEKSPFSFAFRSLICNFVPR